MKKAVQSRTPIVAVLSAAALLAACGGGSDSNNDSTGTGTGTMRLSLTDAPACGYDTVFVTIEKVRVHQSGSAGENDAGWSEVVLNAPQRIDLLTLTNGALLPLGQTELPAATYTQMRLVLAPNTATNPLANAIKPTGGAETALTTPSGQQSGLKANVNLTVPAGQVADFAIDFDACKSFVKAGNSGKYILKPVLAVIPILSAAGQRIVGFVDPTLAVTSTSVSAQSAGVPLRATPPDATGRFTLYPVPAGNYDLVITAAGRVNAVMTGVPVSSDVTTVIGSDAARINTPPSAASYAASGTIKVNGSLVDTGGAVRALQPLTGGPTIEAGAAMADDDTGVYSLMLPAGAPGKLAYVAGATTFPFVANAADAGKYKLEPRATVAGLVVVKPAVDIVLAAPVITDFLFP
ncbi:MAG TPA: DUF4382 domain-containing protein [Burkholderiaceae bacterium]